MKNFSSPSNNINKKLPYVVFKNNSNLKINLSNKMIQQIY